MNLLFVYAPMDFNTFEGVGVGIATQEGGELDICVMHRTQVDVIPAEQTIEPCERTGLCRRL